MSNFRFRGLDGIDIAPEGWLQTWAARYPSAKYDPEHDRLTGLGDALSSSDFESIGKWKDAAWAKWRPNVASVAYNVWMEAAASLPSCPDESHLADFLTDWSQRRYTDTFPSKTVIKRFGLSRATTLLYFISRQRYPIFDARVRRALTRLRNAPAFNTVSWYLDSYRQILPMIATLCGTTRLRTVDKALFSYGVKALRFQ